MIPTILSILAIMATVAASMAFYRTRSLIRRIDLLEASIGGLEARIGDMTKEVLGAKSDRTKR